MRARTIVLVIAAVVVVAIGGGAWWWASQGVQAVDDEVPLTQAAASGDAERVATALEALETDPASLLPPELEEAFGGEVGSAIPEGTTVAADPSTWTPSTAGGGTIVLTLTAPDGSTNRMIAIMAEYPDGWKVLQTIEVQP